jgi:hypothetical protein
MSTDTSRLKDVLWDLRASLAILQKNAGSGEKFHFDVGWFFRSLTAPVGEGSNLWFLLHVGIAARRLL